MNLAVVSALTINHQPKNDLLDTLKDSAVLMCLSENNRIM